MKLNKISPTHYWGMTKTIEDYPCLEKYCSLFTNGCMTSRYISEDKTRELINTNVNGTYANFILDIRNKKLVSVFADSLDIDRMLDGCYTIANTFICGIFTAKWGNNDFYVEYHMEDIGIGTIPLKNYNETNIPQYIMILRLKSKLLKLIN